MKKNHLLLLVTLSLAVPLLQGFSFGTYSTKDMQTDILDFAKDVQKLRERYEEAGYCKKGELLGIVKRNTEATRRYKARQDNNATLQPDQNPTLCIAQARREDEWIEAIDPSIVIGHTNLTSLDTGYIGLSKHYRDSSFKHIIDLRKKLQKLKEKIQKSGQEDSLAQDRGGINEQFMNAQEELDQLETTAVATFNESKTILFDILGFRTEPAKGSNQNTPQISKKMRSAIKEVYQLSKNFQENLGSADAAVGFARALKKIEATTKNRFSYAKVLLKEEVINAAYEWLKKKAVANATAAAATQNAEDTQKTKNKAWQKNIWDDIRTFEPVLNLDLTTETTTKRLKVGTSSRATYPALKENLACIDIAAIPQAWNDLNYLILLTHGTIDKKMSSPAGDNSLGNNEFKNMLKAFPATIKDKATLAGFPMIAARLALVDIATQCQQQVDAYAKALKLELPDALSLFKTSGTTGNNNQPNYTSETKPRLLYRTATGDKAQEEVVAAYKTASSKTRDALANLQKESKRLLSSLKSQYGSLLKAMPIVSYRKNKGTTSADDYLARKEYSRAKIALYNLQAVMALATQAGTYDHQNAIAQKNTLAFILNTMNPEKDVAEFGYKTAQKAWDPKAWDTPATAATAAMEKKIQPAKTNNTEPAAQAPQDQPQQGQRPEGDEHTKPEADQSARNENANQGNPPSETPQEETESAAVSDSQVFRLPAIGTIAVKTAKGDPARGVLLIWQELNNPLNFIVVFDDGSYQNGERKNKVINLDGKPQDLTNGQNSSQSVIADLANDQFTQTHQRLFSGLETSAMQTGAQAAPLALQNTPGSAAAPEAETGTTHDTLDASVSGSTGSTAEAPVAEASTGATLENNPSEGKYLVKDIVGEGNAQTTLTIVIGHSQTPVNNVTEIWAKKSTSHTTINYAILRSGPIESVQGQLCSSTARTDKTNIVITGNKRLTSTRQVNDEKQKLANEKYTQIYPISV